MIQKKSQITASILAGVAIVVAGVLIYSLSDINIKASVPFEVRPVAELVNFCLEDAAITGTYILADKGGFIEDYNNKLSAEKKEIAYHFRNTKTGPSKEYMQDQLSDFIEDYMAVCIDDFKSIEHYSIKQGNIDVKSSIEEKSIIVNLDYPLNIIKNNTDYYLSEFETSIPIRLSYILDVIDQMIDNLDDNIDIIELASKDIEITVMPYDHTNFIYTIYDKKSNIKETPFIFNFAVDQGYEKNNPPVIHDISPKTAKMGELFETKITVYDPAAKLTFRDETPLFDIDDEGNIKFVPMKPNIGQYDIPIYVSDGEFEVSKIMKINIIDNEPVIDVKSYSVNIPESSISTSVNSQNGCFAKIDSTPSTNYASISSCDQKCQELGCSSGECKWPRTAQKAEDLGYSLKKLGTCFIEDTRHCGQSGQCNCYCFE